MVELVGSALAVPKYFCITNLQNVKKLLKLFHKHIIYSSKKCCSTVNRFIS